MKVRFTENKEWENKSDSFKADDREQLSACFLFPGKPFWVRLAGEPLLLKSRYPFTEELFGPYRIEPEKEDWEEFAALMKQAGLEAGPPVSVSEIEIEREQEYTELAPEGYDDSYLESLAIYRKLCRILLCRDIVLFHCSALRIDGAAYLFTAPSGTGKSTHTALWRECFGSRVEMINDDKPLLRIGLDGVITAYGTPYGGKDNIQANIDAPVGGIIVLARGERNRICRLSEKEAYPFLFTQTYLDREDPAALLHTMGLIEQLSRLPVFRMECTISLEAARMAYETVKGIDE